MKLDILSIHDNYRTRINHFLVRSVALIILMLGVFAAQAQGPYPLVDVLPSPSVVNTNVGDSFTIVLQLDAQDAQVTVADIFMQFDQTKVQVNSTAFAPGTPLNIPSFPATIDNVNGTWSRGGFSFSPATTLFDHVIIQCTAIGEGTSLMEHSTSGPLFVTLLAYAGEDVTGTIDPIQINIIGYDCPTLSVNNGDPCQIGSDSGEYVNCECEIYDCAGVPGGTASLDDCNVCSGGTTGVEPCLNCGPGTYEFQGACTTCPAGSYCPGDGNSYPCAAGEYQGATGQVTCLPCDAGSFSSTVGATECTSCAAGTFSATAGATECTPCAAGTFSDT